MKRRHVTRRVLAALADTLVVFVQGPRQLGKTTLVQRLAKAGHSAEYLSFDDAAVLEAARSDPDGFVAGLPSRVILDEVQRVSATVAFSRNLYAVPVSALWRMAGNEQP